MLNDGFLPASVYRRFDLDPVRWNTNAVMIPEYGEPLKQIDNLRSTSAEKCPKCQKER